MRALLPLLLGVVLLLGACSGVGDDGAPDSPAGPAGSAASADNRAGSAPVTPPRPKVGACYRLRFSDALSPTSSRPAVPCRARHTSVTYHVGRLDLGPQGARRVDSRRAQRQVADACPRLLRDHLGGTPDQVRRSMLQAVWFTPTLEQADAGASWFRCDVVAPGPGESLAQLPARLRGALADPALRERFATCATSAPGTSRFRPVPCTEPHSWRAAVTVELPGDAYPSAEAMAEAMDGPCTTAAQDSAEDPLDFTWSEERPTREQWRGGRRHGTCWVPEAG